MSTNHRTPPYMLYILVFVTLVALATLGPVAALWSELAELIKPVSEGPTPTN